MTTNREEIEVQGSDDGVAWKAYEFPYKPGNVYRQPPIVAPYQPRLDWQMWFAALGSYRENQWFMNFMVRLLQGEPSVTHLLNYNPFPKTPPKYVRAVTYSYTFTHYGDRSWWNRVETGSYLSAKFAFSWPEKTATSSAWPSLPQKAECSPESGTPWDACRLLRR